LCEAQRLVNVTRLFFCSPTRKKKTRQQKKRQKKKHKNIVFPSPKMIQLITKKLKLKERGKNKKIRKNEAKTRKLPFPSLAE